MSDNLLSMLKNGNKNYLSVLVTFLVLFCALFYFYRLLFATIILSYGFGCLASYIVINPDILNNVFVKLKAHLVEETPKGIVEDNVNKGCATCKSVDCPRHDQSALEPWTGLQVHKQLDQSIEEFYNTIIEQFINSWYNKISLQPFFVDEIRHQLRFASATLLRRAIKINFSKFITERLLPCALHHYTLCADLGDGAQLLDSKLAIHPAASNRNAELKYLRSITNAIMPYLLKANELQNSIFYVLVREIFAGWVLLSLTDVLADPYILNTLILLATGDETMASLPNTPNYKVEFLETFVRQTDSVYTQRSKILKLDLDYVLDDQEMFYAFMQYLKTTSHIYLLQFYKDIKSFQTKLLNPLLCDKEQRLLIEEAKDIHLTYFDINSASRISIDSSLAEEMKDLLCDSVDCIKKLQTSKALYQASRQCHAFLEKIMLPRFLHSEEFYMLYIGSRIPTGYNKNLAKKTQDKQSSRSKSKALKSTLDGQLLETDLADSDSENLDILKYLDSLAAEDGLSDHDLRCYKVVLTDVEVKQQEPPRRGPVRVFTLCVHRHSGPIPQLLNLKRTEHHFHLLNSKLHEFHGTIALRPLPSRRDNSPLETLRYKYEDYIQQLLLLPILQTSELLHLFLTFDGDFSIAVQASTMSGNSTDLVNIYQSVAHKLKKEKGQHLEGFLINFLVTSDMERYHHHALKQGSVQIEEAIEVSEDILQPTTLSQVHNREIRNILGGVFGNNFGVEPVVTESYACQDVVSGFTQCLMFLMSKITKTRALLVSLVGCVLSMSRESVDDTFNNILDNKLRELLSERTLAHLIRLGHTQIFGKQASTPRADSVQQRHLAKTQLIESIPASISVIAGKGTVDAVCKAFDVIQSPQLNKQLVYELLDLCLAELFPELLDDLNTDKPKR